MIDKSKQNTTLKVCLEDVGTHNRAILDFFFAKLGRHIFRCVDTQEEASVLLIDYDFPPARQRFETEYQEWKKPAIILSISEVSVENSIWLAKPLTSRALLDAASTLQQQVTSSTQQQTTASSGANLSQQQPSESTATAAQTILQRPPIQELTTPATIPLVNKLDKELPTKSAEPAEIATDSADSAAETKPNSNNETSQPSEAEINARNLLLCGDNPDVDVSTDINESFYQSDSFFLSSLKDAVRLARQCQQGVLLNFPTARIYVLPEIHRIFCGFDIYAAEFTDLIAGCNIREGGKMHILSTREIHELNDMISQQSSALYDLEAFVWTSSLLSSQGSLPRELDPKKPVGLKHWPSLTRLENFPHVLPIAAQWSATSMSAFDIAKSLNIPQRYVFSFYNAANSLSLIEQDPDKLINKQSVPRTKDAPRGLFSRLLKRLVGG